MATRRTSVSPREEDEGKNIHLRGVSDDDDNFIAKANTSVKKQKESSLKIKVR